MSASRNPPGTGGVPASGDPGSAPGPDDFAALLAPVLDRAYAMALRLTREPADAEDLVQEAALLAYRGFSTFRSGTNFRAWFLRVLMNAFLSSKRRRRPEDDAVPLDDVPRAYIQRQARAEAQRDGRPAAAAPGDLAREVVGRIEAEAVASAVDALPEEFRSAAALYFLEDLSYGQIAETLGIPVGTVRSRLHRGRALLQRRLWRIAQDHGLATGGTEGP